ncbi:type I polyketide synthase [Phytohabitans houttuyneae]|uniref:Polyketide synthase n=1 Tax=Phytohabitans houttuyneae TaxID=1076126 RepID=A0A6V8K020_9ACTN|nr:type I polyketide synthase [Phytohabitans houttuyneae]GFJ76870.1 polyketide synthase [Phytohabitans houttuyneae]
MTEGVAVVGMACRYPDANSPRDLWENAIAGRRAFRRLPDERMRLDDYWSPDPAADDRFYSRMAAVIEGYEFDRVAYKVPGSTYRSTDLTHWLALDVAAAALADAGFPDGDGLPRERTGVVIGNTLTGEFTRANVMRLRWPYVRRAVGATLAGRGWPEDELADLLDELEQVYKSPFPASNEDSLAGGLANTIAGRICNHFDLNGGGYTVDGACSSSLLSLLTAANSLVDGDLDVAVAGGVDLSIDPFELVGFAKTGALARREMRVYDRDSNGFWPGEGCGMVVLMRERDARAAGHRAYAILRGWGMSSDGRGGITRPEEAGYRLALRRAYTRAGIGIETVSLFEGHGTGTAVGDATELRSLSRARREADPDAPPAAIGSVKAMIGHTKAAAGVAGLIKAAMAVHHEVLPPTVGSLDPHPELTGEAPALRVLRTAEPWPEGRPVRAGVTAMGFGGINTHIVLERPEGPRRPPDHRARALAATVQDAELLLVDAASASDLRARLDELARLAPRLSYAELADLAATLQRELRDRAYRAAAVVRSPEDAERQLTALRGALDAGRTAMLAEAGDAFLGHVTRPARIGYLFPGQGSGRGTSGGALRRRFPSAGDVYAGAALPTGGDTVATAVAQPRIVVGSMAGLRVLTALGVEASVALGHSLGELTTLCWAGALDEPTLLRMATVRGATMAANSEPGTMAGVAAGPERVARLIDGEPVVVAGYNGPRQTVVAGPVDAVRRVCRAAGDAGLVWAELPVSHAFHSPLMVSSAAAFGEWLSEVGFRPVSRRVVSTVTGELLDPHADLPSLLRQQIVQPVRFDAAVAAAAPEVDLFIEVGPGHVLTRMVRDLTRVPAVAIDTDSESIASLLAVLGAAYVSGAPVAHRALFDGRLTRPLPAGDRFSFFANPCEAAPDLSPAPARTAAPPPPSEEVAAPDGDALSVLRRLVAERAELPPNLVGDGSRLLDDLHLSSITVGQVVSQATRELGLSAVRAPTNFATATVGQLADALDELARTGAGNAPAPSVEGIDTWVRPFAVHLVPAIRPEPAVVEPDGAWQVHAPAGHPLAQPLRAALEESGVGGGVLICLPEETTEAALATALAGVQAAIRQPDGGRLVLLQHGRGAAGLARTARLEAAALRTTVVRAPLERSIVDQVVADVAATTGYSEVEYGAGGERRVPVLRPVPAPQQPGQLPLGSGDVLLVTGGGKGITAECARVLAAETGAALAILGRSDPASDEELAGNLARLRAAVPKVRYLRADVTDEAAVRTAVARVRTELGPVTAVLHGAGRNEPASLADLDPDDLRRTLAPKVGGLRAVLDAVEPGDLRLLVTFGSIIGRAGLAGEGHYALANEWLAELTAEARDTHPGCRAVCLEWSVWSGVGMGERLSVVESLLRSGVTPITTDQGVRVLREVLATPDLPPALVVTGRTGALDTLTYDRPELPLLRFIDRVLVHYPGVELVTELDLSPGGDPYLDDHLLDGDLLFPAVLGMEAMAQVAAALTGDTDPPLIEEAVFARPIVVPRDGATTVRIAALATAPGMVRLAIRSAETGFGVDHFRATLRCWTGEVPEGGPEPAADLPWVPLDPPRDLYGDVLFQGRRFQRLRRYRRVAARHAEADVATDQGTAWFSAFLPGQLLLGDPGARDAFMHGIQVCVPDATLLPMGVERLYPAGPKLASAGEVTFAAVEREHSGDTYVYDVAVRDRAGTVVERWEGLRLRAVRKRDGSGPWAPALLGPFLQRRLEGVLAGEVAVAVDPRNGARPASTAVLSRALGRPVRLRHRPDGRPELAGESDVDSSSTVSTAHGTAASLAVAGDGDVACDVETVTPRDRATWDDLLGTHARLADVIVAETAEPFDVAATRVWCAVECLQKAGRPTAAPIVLQPGAGPGWSVLAAGEVRIATLATSLRGADEPVVIAVLGERKD